MKKVFATLILGAASAALFAASFLTTDAASYMDWAKESTPAIHQEMKAMKSTLPFHEEKEKSHDHYKKGDHEKENSHDRSHMKKEEKQEKKIKSDRKEKKWESREIGGPSINTETAPLAPKAVPAPAAPVDQAALPDAADAGMGNGN